ncbi:uncharacterized protein LOC111897122 [Lactuca sativa]|uniref:uncharacterized protein LOC111897122 n=1 Tax=Lactuca sativa TaxID=4236 RepID=UPI000CD948C4|nr:uncharacterized protein LOC111897122 [Lactuca sativa]
MPCYLPRLKVHQPTGVQASQTHKVVEEEEEITTGEEEAAYEDEVRLVGEVIVGAVTHDRRQTLSTKKPRDKSNIRCYECQELGHYASECKAKKQQDQEVNLAADEEEPTLLLTVCGEKNIEVVLLNEEKVYPSQLKESNEENIWYLDNGASNHMIGCRGLFAELNEKVTGQVRFGDGSRVPIKGKGALLFDCKNGDQFDIPDVYYIPALHNNIISLGQMTEEGYDIGMKNEFLRMYDEAGILVMKVQRSKNRLYKIKLTPGKPVCLAMSIDDDSWLWHARMGHTNFRTLEEMTCKKMVLGMPQVTHLS